MNVSGQGWVTLSGVSVAGVDCSCLKVNKFIFLPSEMMDSLMLKGNGKRVVMIITLLTRYWIR